MDGFTNIKMKELYKVKFKFFMTTVTEQYGYFVTFFIEFLNLKMKVFVSFKREN